MSDVSSKSIRKRSAGPLPGAGGGLLVHFDPNFRKKAVGRLLEFLNSVIEPSEEHTASAGSLEEEVNALRRQRPKINVRETGVNDNILIQMDKNICPLELASKAVVFAKNMGISPSPHVTKLLPVQATSTVSAYAIAQAAEPLIHDSMRSFKGSFAIVWRRRCSETADRQKIIDAVVAIVQKFAPDATVELDDPDVAILVEVLKTTSYISVLPQWAEMSRYNMLTASKGDKS